MAWNQFGWHHPDEWFQTVEFARFWAEGAMSGSQEVFWHLRNQSLPLLLAPLLKLFDDPPLRLAALQTVAGLSVLPWLGFVHAWTRNRAWPQSARLFTLLTVAFGFFLFRDSIRPSSENFSSACLAAMLWAFELGRLGSSAFWAVAAVAMRYPSALAVMGFALAAIAGNQKQRSLLRDAWKPLLSGTVVACVVFGLPDAWVYGRPWESFYMFIMYNVVSDLATSRFGAQSWEVYLKIGGLPGTLAVLAGVLGIGTLAWRERRSPWMAAWVCYVIGHLAVEHKETRFMFPILPLVALGWGALLMKLPTWLQRGAWMLTAVHCIVAVATAAGFPRREGMLMFKVPPRAERECAALVPQALPSSLWPRDVALVTSSHWIEQPGRCASLSPERRRIWISGLAASPPRADADCTTLQSWGKFAAWNCALSAWDLPRSNLWPALMTHLPKHETLPRLSLDRSTLSQQLRAWEASSPHALHQKGHTPHVQGLW